MRERKRTGDRSLSTLGSVSLCRSLLDAGVVDRFRLVVFPVITGRTGQERIYDGYPDVALEMVDSRTFDGRIQLLEYIPTVINGPPGRRRAGGQAKARKKVLQFASTEAAASVVKVYAQAQPVPRASF